MAIKPYNPELFDATHDDELVLVIAEITGLQRLSAVSESAAKRYREMLEDPDMVDYEAAVDKIYKEITLDFHRTMQECLVPAAEIARQSILVASQLIGGDFQIPDFREDFRLELPVLKRDAVRLQEEIAKIDGIETVTIEAGLFPEDDKSYGEVKYTRIVHDELTPDELLSSSALVNVGNVEGCATRLKVNKLVSRAEVTARRSAEYLEQHM